MNNGKTFQRTGDRESAPSVQQLKYQSEKTVLNFGVVLSHIGEPGYLSRYSDSLRAGRSGDRTPVKSRFSASFQTSSEAHPASYTISTGSFLRVKRQGRGVDHPPLTSSVEVKERVELYPYCHSGLF